MTGAARTDETAFPWSWSGIWKGVLETVQRQGSGRLSVAMELHVLPAGDGARARWVIVYGEGEQRQVRDYELVAVDAASGHYLIDEKNSIEIDAYLIGPCLYSRFDVAGNLLLVTYRREREEIIFEVVSGRSVARSVTGGQDSVPPVASYAVDIAQRAVLVRAAGE